MARQFAFIDIGLTSEPNATRNIAIQTAINVGQAWIPENTITIGFSFYVFDEPDRNVAIVHEVLHLFYGSHEQITKELFGFKADNDIQARRALMTFLNSHCLDFDGE